MTGAGSGDKSLLVLGFESPHHPVDDAMDIASGHSQRPRRRQHERADGPKTDE